MKKIISLLLAFLLAAGVVVSLSACKTNKNKNDETTARPAVTGEPSSDLAPLEVKDFDNVEFKILWPEVHSDGHFMHNELDADSSSENLIDKAVYNRTRMVEDTYNVDIVVELMWVSTIGNTMRAMASTGDVTYQAAATNIGFLTTAATEGALADFNHLAYYNENQSWWDHATMESYSIGGARYFGMGDIIYSDNFYPYCIFANLDLAEEYGIDTDFYDLALGYDWTYEELLKYSKIVPKAGEGDAWDYTASYGTLLNANTAKALYYGFGRNVVVPDENGYPSWVMTPSYAEPVLNNIMKIFWDSEHAGYATDDDIGHNEPGLNHADTAIKMFMNNQALFYAEELIISERLNTRGSKMDFAILPMPLENDDQTAYRCVLNDATVITIPSGWKQNELDDISLILSAMGRASVDTLTPAFFENVLTYRYMTNPKSVQTLRLILSSIVAPDIATILNWGGMMQGFKRVALTGEGSFATVYGENIDTAENELTLFIKKLKFYQK